MNKHLKQQGELKDRGRTKWTAMMLTEHLQLLREWQNEDNLTPRPTLDEFDLQLIGEEIERAYNSQSEVRIKTWNDGYIKQHRGKIIEINSSLKYLVYDHPFGTSRLQLGDIISIDNLDLEGA